MLTSNLVPNDIDTDIDFDDPAAEYESYLASLQQAPPAAQHANFPSSDVDLAQILPAFIFSLTNSGCACPFCDAQTLQTGPNNTFGCTSCGAEVQTQFAALSFAAHVQSARSVRFSDLNHVPVYSTTSCSAHHQHTPLIASDPNLGTLFLCTSVGCDWCEALD
jgi:hypothetical protein